MVNSIKRLEIVGEVAERVGLADAGSGAGDELVEELARHKTLAGLVGWLVGRVSETVPEPLTTAFCISPAAAAALRSVRVLAPVVVEVVGAVKTSGPVPACSSVPPRLMSSVRSVVSPVPV